MKEAVGCHAGRHAYDRGVVGDNFAFALHARPDARGALMDLDEVFRVAGEPGAVVTRALEIEVADGVGIGSEASPRDLGDAAARP